MSAISSDDCHLCAKITSMVFVRKPMPAKTKDLAKEKFTNLFSFSWSIKILGSYELVVRGPIPTDATTRRQSKSYGSVLDVKCVKASKQNAIPIIRINSIKGWLHVDPFKYDAGNNSDLALGAIMFKHITSKNTINARMGKT